MNIGLYKKNFMILALALVLIVSNSLVVNAATAYGRNQNQSQQKLALSVSITKPLEGHYYINDVDYGATVTGVTWVLGDLTIEASPAGGEGGIERVEFYISEVNRFTDYEAPYSWLWDDSVIGGITIKVKAFDTVGNEASKSLDVLVIMNLEVAEAQSIPVAESMIAQAVACGDISAEIASNLILNSNSVAMGTYQ